MKKTIQRIGVLSFLCFSFYLTSNLAIFMKKNDPVYESILVMKEDYEKDALNAKIKNEYMIPGLNGLSIDLDHSYQKMHKNGALEVSKLVYEEKKPNISMENNKDKIIFQANPLKRGVSFVIDSEEISTYFDELGIAYAILTTKENVNHHYEFGEKINSDIKNYEDLEVKLKKKGEDIAYCYVKEVDRKLCLQHDKYLFLETKRVTNANFSKEYTLVSSGDILFITKNTSLSYINVLLHQIKFKGLNVLPLTKLLSEERL